MSNDFHSRELLTNSTILKAIQNLSFMPNETQVSNNKVQTHQKDCALKNKLKNKTMPPSMHAKISKVTQFEKLIHSKVSDLILKQFIIDLYRGVKYLTKSLVGPDQRAIHLKQVELKEPTQSKQKFLFLDLDETLISTERQTKSNSKSNQISFKIRIRPYTRQFLSNISKHYNIYIFTAATKEYAEAVINKLDQEKNIIQDYLCRDDCFQTKRGKVIKDLRIVKNRSLKDMVLVDNKPESFGLQIDNGVPILDFYGDKNDVELQHLEKVLIQICKLQDVRMGISAHFRLRELAELSKEELQDYVKKGGSFVNSEKKLNQFIKS